MIETHALWLAVLIAFLTLVSTVVGFLINWIREDQRHQWHQEEMRRSAQHLSVQDEAILEGANDAKKAYTEANLLNEKINDLQKQIDHHLALAAKLMNERAAKAKNE